VSTWDDDDGEELRPLKPFRPAIPRAGHPDDRSRGRAPRPGPDPDGPRGPLGGPGGGPRRPVRPDGPDDEVPSGLTPARRVLLGAAAVVALLLVVLLVSSCRSQDSAREAEQDVVDRFLAAYAERSYADMFETIDTDAQRVYPVKRFAGLNRDAFRMATGRTILVGEATRREGEFVAPVTVRTLRFGSLRADLRIRLVGSGEDARVAWTRNMAFPGLRTGERLSRVAQVPLRGTILFRDGATPLAKGPGRTSTAPAELVSQVRGELGPIPDEEQRKYRDLGIPATTKIGKNGLERLLNDELIGRPALTLKAGSRVIARQKAKRARAVVSSISLPVMQAAVDAQSSAPSGGGLLALDTTTGEVLAFAGNAWTGPRAPGSTMKIVTAAAALQEGTAEPDTDYPVATSALGIQNADGESCGGTLVESFAESCNSVFAPLAVRVGSTPFVRTAEAFGFNRAPAVQGASRSTIPDDLSDGDLALSGIGQAKVQATPLQVAMMAATVATGGVQPALTFLRTDDEAKTRRVLPSGVAADLRTMMRAVITEGTGTAAGLPGVEVAGKTGTAEVRTTQGAACRDGSATGGADDDDAAGTAGDDAGDDDAAGTAGDGGTGVDGAAFHPRGGALLRPAGLTLAQDTTPDGGVDPDDLDGLDDLDDAPTTTDDATPVEPLDDDPSGGTTICDPSDSTDTDAWMAAFAPASSGDGSPVAVGVLRRGDGQGGATAAPVARAILEAALQP
jgi:hypothetical protein